jgi:ABC-2 type transport system ATP-binding protein
VLSALAGVSELRLDRDGGEVRVSLYADRGGSLIADVARVAAGSSLSLTDVHLSEPSLETLFLHHTGRSLRE